MSTYIPKLSRKDRTLRRQCVAEHVAAGLPIGCVSAIFDLSYTQCFEACKERGVRVPEGGPQTCTAQTFSILARLQNTRDAVADIAREHGVPLKRVDRIRADALAAGVLMQHRGIPRVRRG